MRAPYKFSRLNATPDVRVSVPNVIVAVPIPQTVIVAVVPITADDQNRGSARNTLK